MSVLRVVVTRTGGFAGITKRAEVDDPDRAEHLSEAVRASADRTGESRVRDGFVYEFTLVASSETEVVDLVEGAMDASLRRVVRDLFT